MSASLLVTADIGALWWMLEHHFLDVLKSYRVWHEGTIWYVDSCSHLFSEYRVSSFFFFFIPPWKVYWIDHCYFFQCECIPCHFKGIAYEIRYFQLIIARTWWVWSRNIFFVSVFWNKSSKGTKFQKFHANQKYIYIYIIPMKLSALRLRRWRKSNVESGHYWWHSQIKLNYHFLKGLSGSLVFGNTAVKTWGDWAWGMSNFHV